MACKTNFVRTSADSGLVSSQHEGGNVARDLFSTDDAVFLSGPVGALEQAVAKHYGATQQTPVPHSCRVTVSVDEGGPHIATHCSDEAIPNRHTPESYGATNVASFLEHLGARIRFTADEAQLDFAAALCEAFGLDSGEVGPLLVDEWRWRIKAG